MKLFTPTPRTPFKHCASHNFRPQFTVRARNISLPLGKKTKIMGILNLTPDSFSGDGFLTKNYSPALGLELAQKLIQDGADIIDVGGESTRPSARFISAKEEIRRIIPTIKLLTKKIKKPISVDTYKEPVAKAALDCGAAIVNNIKGTSLDKSLIKTIKSYRAAIVLMHIRGNPKTMQKNIRYQNVIAEIISELKESIEKCLEFGLSSDKIIVDPGIGFGKTVDQNFEIIRRLSEFKTLGFPILVGTSRKSFIGKALNKEAHQRLWGTAASVAAAILNGAHIVRVHDVKEMRDVVKVTDAILNAKNKN